MGKLVCVVYSSTVRSEPVEQPDYPLLNTGWDEETAVSIAFDELDDDQAVSGWIDHSMEGLAAAAAEDRNFVVYFIGEVDHLNLAGELQQLTLTRVKSKSEINLTRKSNE